jgi:hypothetical protein
MLPPRLLPDGKLRVPARAEAADGTIGDGVKDIGPDDPDYERWLPFVPPLNERLPKTRP